jgi:endonuclease/exonuclease/phosphatase (EEP) superfamily protein YafD
MNELLTWLASYGPNQLVGGDFNAEPDEVALWTNWLTSRRDVWAQVTAATGEPGFTKDKRTVTGKPGRIDYQFAPADPAHVGVQQSGVVHTVLSDHHALVVDYVIQ